MNELLFNDASNEFTCFHVAHIHLQLPLNLESEICAPVQFIVFHLLHTDRMQL